MKKLLLVALVAALAGCSTTVPVTAKFPEAPDSLLNKTCPELNKLPEKSQLSTIAKTVSDNYVLYYQCAVKVDAWSEWYKEQKKIYEGVK